MTLAFAMFLTRSPLNYFLRIDEQLIDMILIYIIPFVMRGKIVSLPVTCKINSALSDEVQNSIYLSSANFWKQATKPHPAFWNSSKKILKTSPQQTKIRQGKFNMNHQKFFKKCLVTYKILQYFLGTLN